MGRPRCRPRRCRPRSRHDAGHAGGSALAPWGPVRGNLAVHYGVMSSFKVSAKISAKISAKVSAKRPAVSAEPAVSFTMATRFGAQQQKR